MLINTVVLLLRDLLPIFILLAYLRAAIIPEAFYRKNVRNIAVTSFLFTLLVMQVVEPLSSALDGTGIEITHIVLYLLSYLLLISATLLKNYQRAHGVAIALASFAIEIFIVLKASSFFIFLHVYLQDKANFVNVLTGVGLGLGICLSIGAILYYLFKEWQQSQFRPLLSIFWCLFLAGLGVKTVPLIAQIGVLDLSAPLFNSEHWVSNSSEYGQLLAALLGYQASPSPEYLISYSIFFITPLLAAIILRRHFCGR